MLLTPPVRQSTANGWVLLQINVIWRISVDERGQWRVSKKPFLNFFVFFCPYPDMEVVRPYTPVDQSLTAASHPSSQESDLYLMIKVYPDGLLTSHLNSLHVGKSEKQEDDVEKRQSFTVILVLVGSVMSSVSPQSACSAFKLLPVYSSRTACSCFNPTVWNQTGGLFSPISVTFWNGWSDIFTYLMSWLLSWVKLFFSSLTQLFLLP